MGLTEFRLLAEIFSQLFTPLCLIAVTVMQIINFIRNGMMRSQINKVENATNSLMAVQRVADHARGVMDEKNRQSQQES